MSRHEGRLSRPWPILVARLRGSRRDHQATERKGSALCIQTWRPSADERERIHRELAAAEAPDEKSRVIEEAARRHRESGGHFLGGDE